MDGSTMAPASDAVWQANAPLVLQGFARGDRGGGGMGEGGDGIAAPLLAPVAVFSLWLTVSISAAQRAYLVTTGQTMLQMQNDYDR